MFVLVHKEARRRAEQAVREAPEGWVVTVKEPTRSGEQNARLHVMLTEIAATRSWAGKRREAEVWKRLLTASWLRARGESVEVLPALDGHGVDVVFRRTSSLTKREAGELMDFIEAWLAQSESAQPTTQEHQ